MVDFQSPVFYLGMDFYQGLPGFWLFPNYYLIVYRAHPVIKHLPFAGRIFSLADKINEAVPRSSGHLLAHPLAQEFIKKQAHDRQVYLAFFKPNKKLEIIAARKGWHLLGNRQSLARWLENKIRLWQALHRYSQLPFPPGMIGVLGDFSYSSLSRKYNGCFVLQLGYGWAGRSTFKVCSETKFVRLQQKYPKQWVKVTEFLPGWTLTNNNVVTKKGDVYSSSLAWQITGQREFCPGLAMATCGRVWAKSPGKTFEDDARRMGRFVGSWLYRQGFRGFFGLDFLLTTDGRFYFQEFNRV